MQFLTTAEGRIAYEVWGSGPLVVMGPGMGDLRTTWRFTVPALLGAGFRVATFDLRGHGESDTTFTSYDDLAAASDMIALVEHLGAPAVLVGNSMSAGAAVWAASERPELVSALALVGPFVRQPKLNPVVALAMRILTAPPWARRVWGAYLPTLYAGVQPPDLPAYLASVQAAMALPGHARAFSRTSRTSHRPIEPRVSTITVPTLVVMGDSDPDFAKPADEAQWIRDTLHGELLMVPQSGHYPHAQRPDIVNPVLVDFVTRATRNA